MPDVQQWARVRARTSWPLRRGAWYRVVDLTPLEAVLEVNLRPLRVPRPFVQVLPIRPGLWSVVPRLRDAVTPPERWGSRYAVCPRCCARAPLTDSVSMYCPGCRALFMIGWSDSHWRVFEIMSGAPDASAIMKAHAAAALLRPRHIGLLPSE